MAGDLSDRVLRQVYRLFKIEAVGTMSDPRLLNQIVSRRDEAAELAGALRQAQAAIPMTLIHSTIRIALGFTAGNTAAVLAQGVLRSMFLHKLKTAAVLLLFGLGSRYWAVRLMAVGNDDKGQGTAVSPPIVAQVPPDKAKAAGSKSTYLLTGSVGDESTGQPVPGARFHVQLFLATPVYGGPNPEEVKTGADGRFSVDVFPGNARFSLLFPPPGYWIPRQHQKVEELVFGPEMRTIHTEFVVRPGTIWDFRLTKGSKDRVPSGIVWSMGLSRAEVDDQGLARLTLPSEGGTFTISLKESPGAPNGAVIMSLESQSGFRPDALKDLSRENGDVRRFRLIDSAGKSATLQAPALVEPINERGRLVIQVAFPEPGPKEDGELVGQVIDAEGQPVEGARVALAISFEGGAQFWSNQPQLWTTDARGQYHLRSVPRRSLDGKPISLSVVVTKDGFAGAESPQFPFGFESEGKPQFVEPLRLEHGVELRGRVVNHQGLPVVGAWVQPVNRSFGSSGWADKYQSVRTDVEGRFTIRNIHRGPTGLFVTYGKLRANHTYLADSSPEEVRIQLPPQPEMAPAENAHGMDWPQPIAVGQPAPEWQPRAWSDGRLRTLAEERGRVVVLYFWNIGDVPSVSLLPALAQLRNQFEPRGVFFLAIHGPGEDSEQVRKVLDFKRTSVLYAIDGDHPASIAKSLGATATRYGLRTFPTLVVIGRDGKVAFRSDDPRWHPRPAAADKNARPEPNRAPAEEERNSEYKRALAREIERVLDRRD